MKTRDLIARLQAADPSGDLECNVDGHDICFVEQLEGYYDGSYQMLVHNPTLRDNAYSIIGGIITTQGRKVRLHTMSLEDALLDNPDLPIEIACMPSRASELAERVAEWRASAREIIQRVKDKTLDFVSVKT